jgi:hypothetical protein
MAKTTEMAVSERQQHDRHYRVLGRNRAEEAFKKKEKQITLKVPKIL